MALLGPASGDLVQLGPDPDDLVCHRSANHEQASAAATDDGERGGIVEDELGADHPRWIKDVDGWL